MGVEFELKYRLPQEALETIAAKMGPGAVFEMETAYYDTADAALAKLRWTLRRRYENGVSVCTLKTPAGGAARNEWEVECGSIGEAVPMLCKLGCPENLPALTAPGLVHICGAKFRRMAWKVACGDSVLELALDRGFLLGGGREMPLSELEVELKSGSREAALEYAQLLAEVYGLVPEEKSKFRRALELAKEDT